MPVKKMTPFRIAVILLAVSTAAVFCVSFLHRGEAKKNGSAAVKTMQKGFSCTASVSWDGGHYVVQIEHPSSGGCSLSFVKPDELRSLSFLTDSGGLKVRYMGMETSLDTSSLPQTALIRSIVGALEAAAVPKDLTAGGTGGELALSGKTQAGRFTLKFGPNFIPKSLSMPDIKLNAAFDRFGFLD